jgi:hypothetical protein
MPGLIRKTMCNVEFTVDAFNKTDLKSRHSSNLAGLINQLKEAESHVDKILFNFQLVGQTIHDLNGDYAKLDKSKMFVMLKSLLQSYNTYLSLAVKLFVKYKTNKLFSKAASSANNTVSKSHAQRVSSTLSQLFDISLKSEYIKKALIQERFIPVLFDLVRDANFRSILDLVLRLLSILINDFDSLDSLQQVDSICVLTDILCDDKLQEWTRTECAGCIGKNLNYLFYFGKL